MPLPVTITGLATTIAPVGPYYNPVLAQQLTGPASAGWGDQASNNGHGQTFTTTSACSLYEVRFNVSVQAGSPTDNITCDIYATSGGLPTGPSLGTSAPVVGSSTSSASMTRFVFAKEVPLSPSTMYAAVLTRGTPNATAYYGAWMASSSLYAGGTRLQFVSGAWVSQASYDCYFAVYANGLPNFYFFGRDSVTATTLRAYKSTAPDTSWAVAASQTSILTTNAADQLAGYQAGSIIHLLALCGPAATAAVRYVQFDMSTDTFGTMEQVVAASALTGQIASGFGASLVVRANGEVVAFYNGVQTKTSGTFRARVYYSRRVGVNSWSAGVQVDTNVAADNNTPEAVLGAADRVHLIWGTGNGGIQRTLSAANALQTASAAQGVATGGPGNQGISYFSGGVTKVIWGPCSSGSRTVLFDSADAPTYTVGQSAAFGMPGRLFYDTTTLYALYGDAANDLSIKTSTNNATAWSAATAVFVGSVGASDIALSMDGGIYQRGNAFVFPYVVNDGGTWKYNEYLVRYVAQADAWNANDRSANVALSNGDKTAVMTTATGAAVRSTQVNPNTTPYYAEFVLNALPCQVGLKAGGASLTDPLSAFAITSSGNIYNSSSLVGNIGARSAGDVIGLAWNGNTAWVRANNGLWNNDPAADPALGVNGLTCQYYGTLWFQANAINASVTVRTEVADLTLTPPAGFKSWMGEVIPAPNAWNVNDKSASAALTYGDVVLGSTSAALANARSTQTYQAGVANKLYAEMEITVYGAGSMSFGVANITAPLGTGSNPLNDPAGSFAIHTNGTIAVNGNVYNDYGAFLAQYDVISIAYDSGAELGWVRVNEDYWNHDVNANPATGVGGMNVSIASVAMALGGQLSGTSNKIKIRTEKAAFTQSTPAGFKSWMGETLVVPDLGTLASGMSTLSGSGTATSVGTGTLTTGVAAVTSNQARSSSVGTGALIQTDHTLISVGTASWRATGTLLNSDGSVLAATGTAQWPPVTGTGGLSAQRAGLVSNGGLSGSSSASGSTPVPDIVISSVDDGGDFIFGAINYGSNAEGQAFIATGTALTKITAKLCVYGAPTDAVRCRISTADVNYLPVASLGTTTLPASSIPVNTTAPVELTFTPPIAISNGQLYHIAFDRTAAADDENIYAINLTYGRVYDPMYSYVRTGSATWETEPSANIVLTISQTAGAVVPPLQGTSPTLVGTGTARWNATGALLNSDGSLLSGTGNVITPPAIGSGVLLNSDGSVLVGTGNARWIAIGALPPINSNMLPWSEQLDQGPDWANYGVIVSANATVAPDSTTTAELVTADGSQDDWHQVWFAGTLKIPATGLYTESAYIKAGTGRWVRFSNSGGTGLYANFDVVNGVVGFNNGVSNIAITAAGNGWWRCSWSYNPAITNNVVTTFNIIDQNYNGTIPYNTAAGSISIWGAQVNPGPLQPYLKTTSTALSIGYTTASLVGSGVSQVVATGTLAPSVATLAGSGTAAFIPRTGDGVLACSITTLTAFGTTQSTGTGVLIPAISTASGAGLSSVAFTAALGAQVSVLAAVGLSTSRQTSAVLAPAPVSAQGVGQSRSVGTAALLDATSTLVGLGTGGLAIGTGALAPAVATLTGSGTAAFLPVFGTGTLTSSITALAAFGISGSVGTAATSEIVIFGGNRQQFTFGDGSPTDAAAQTFISVGTVITSVTPYMARAGSPQDSLIASIHTVVGGLPGALLGVSDPILAMDLAPTTSVPTTFNFSTPVKVVNGGEYIVSFTRTGELDGNFFIVGYGGADIYAPGQFIYNYFGGWTVTPFDLWIVIGQGKGLQTSLAALTGSGASILGGTGVLTNAPAVAVASGISSSRSTAATLQAQTNFLRMGDGLSASVGTAPLAAQPSTTTAAGTSISTGTGALAATTATLAGTGTTFVGVTGSGLLTTIATLAAAGLSNSSSTSAVLTGTISTLVAPGSVTSLGTGVLPRTASASTLAGSGVAAHLATGTLTSQAGVVTSAGLARWVATGALNASGCGLSGSGQVSFAATGTLAASLAQVSGAGISSTRSTSATLQAGVAFVSGFEGVTIISGTGSIPSQSAQVAGAGLQTSRGTGVLVGPAAALAGAGLSRGLGTGALLSQTCVLAATGASTGTGTGVIAATASALSGAGSILDKITGTGDLASQVAGVQAAGNVVPGPTGTGVLAGTASSVAGEGVRAWLATGSLTGQAAALAAAGKTGWTGTAIVAAGGSTVSGAGFARWSGTGVLSPDVSDIAADGVSGSRGTVAALPASRAGVFGYEGVVVISGTGDLQGQSCKLVSSGVGRSFGTGSLPVLDSAELDGAGVSRSVGTGTLTNPDRSTLSGEGGILSFGSGDLASVSTMGGAGYSRWVGGGVLPADLSRIASSGVVEARGTGVLRTDSGAISGSGRSEVQGAAALVARAAQVHGTADLTTFGAGVLEPGAAKVLAVGLSASRGTGLLKQDNHVVVGAPISGSRGTAVIVAKPAKVSGFAVETAYGFGDLQPLPAYVNGNDLVFGAGVIVADASQIAGSGSVDYPAYPVPTDFPGGYPGTATWRGYTSVWRGHTALPGHVPPPWWRRGAA
jgi:hypothetical protein